jgi:hypothetical protein
MLLPGQQSIRRYLSIVFGERTADDYDFSPKSGGKYGGIGSALENVSYAIGRNLFQTPERRNQNGRRHLQAVRAPEQHGSETVFIGLFRCLDVSKAPIRILGNLTVSNAGADDTIGRRRRVL